MHSYYCNRLCKPAYSSQGLEFVTAAARVGRAGHEAEVGARKQASGARNRGMLGWTQKGRMEQWLGWTGGRDRGLRPRGAGEEQRHNQRR